MARPPLLVILALAAAVLCTAAARAQESAPTQAEPNVQRIVTEDDQVRVEELRVRGQTKRIVVRSKLGNGAVTEYEVLPADGGRDLATGPLGGTRGSAGQRVWNVLSF
jgi:hypothetical protein